MRIVVAKQTHEERNGTAAGDGPGENGFNQGRKMLMKMKKCAMLNVVA
jgi:hypothetical protein